MQTLRRRAAIIGAILGVCVAAAAILTLATPRKYQSTVLAVVNPKEVLLPITDLGYATQLDQLVVTYVDLVNQRPVWDLLIADGIPRSKDELLKEIAARREPGTTLVSITITDTDPDLALRIAQEIVPAFNQTLTQLDRSVRSPATGSKLDALVPWSVPTERAKHAASPRATFNLAAGALAGIFLGLAIAFMLEYLDDRLRGRSDVRERLGLPLLGLIPSGADLGAATFRDISQGLELAVRAGVSAVAVASARRSEGRTITAYNLAVNLARQGRRVLLVDADFERPHIHELFQLPPAPGLGDMIERGTPNQFKATPTDVPNLSVLAAGTAPTDPGLLFASDRFKEILVEVGRGQDILVLDMAALHGNEEVAALGAATGATILVADASRTPAAAVVGARDALSGVGANVVGVVLNRA